jgi:hypothetical protein
VTFRDGAPTAATAATVTDAPAPAKRRAAPKPKSPRLEGETHTGRLRRIRAERPSVRDLVPAEPDHSSSFRRRYGIPYDTQGPKVRLGVLWALAVTASLYPQSLRPWGLAVLYGVVAGAAAAQVVDAHRGGTRSTERAIAAFGGSALPVAATLGAQVLGAGFLVLVVAAVIGAVATPDPGRLPLARAGQAVLAAGLCGGAAASLVLLAEYEIGAIIILLVVVLLYDASDFAVGSGAGNGLEGPLAGILMITAATAVFAVVNAPPFGGADIWSFAVLAMVACPAGQILASAMLPAADVHAPALRRLDSLLVVAPAWAGLVGLYLSQAS